MSAKLKQYEDSKENDFEMSSQDSFSHDSVSFDSKFLRNKRMVVNYPIGDGYTSFSGVTETYSGGGTSNAFTVAGVKSGDIVTATIATSSNNVSVTKAVAGADTLTVSFSADPGSGTTVAYTVHTPASEHFFIAPTQLVVVQAQFVASAVSSGACTIGIEKLQDGQASGAGVAVLASTFDAQGTANTVQSVRPTLSTFNKNLKRGDRLALSITGSPLGMKNGIITIEYQYKRQFKQ